MKTKLIIDSEQLMLSDNVKRILKENNIQLTISLLKPAAVQRDKTNQSQLVLLHGMCACKEVFNDLIKHFQSKYDVYAFDLPGHGASFTISNMDRLSTGEKDILAEALYNLPQVADMLSLAFKKLEIKQADVYGWSIGGHIAHGMATSHPELFNSLTTTGTPPINYANQEEFRIGFTDLFVDNYLKDWKTSPTAYKDEVSKIIANSMGFSDTKEKRSKDYYFVEAIKNSDPLFRKYLYTTLIKYIEHPELHGRDFLEKTKIPLFFIEGEKDAGIKFTNTHAFYKEISESKDGLTGLYSFPNDGHAPFRTNPTIFSNQLAYYLTQARNNAKKIVTVQQIFQYWIKFHKQSQAVFL